MKNLRFGKHSDVLSSDRWDTLITEPPFIGSCATHESDVRKFVAWAAERTRGWMVILCSKRLLDTYIDALQSEGRFENTRPRRNVFTVLDRRPEAAANPWVVASRPWVDMPFEWPHEQRKELRAQPKWLVTAVGCRSAWSMTEFVRDYSKPGDLVCDPFAGSASTLVAAIANGRGILGAESDKATFETSSARLGELPRVAPIQLSLFEGIEGGSHE